MFEEMRVPGVGVEKMPQLAELQCLAASLPLKVPPRVALAAPRCVIQMPSPGSASAALVNCALTRVPPASTCCFGNPAFSNGCSR